MLVRLTCMHVGWSSMTNDCHVGDDDPFDLLLMPEDPDVPAEPCHNGNGGNSIMWLGDGAHSGTHVWWFKRGCVIRITFFCIGACIWISAVLL